MTSDPDKTLQVKQQNIYYTKNPNSGLIEARDVITNEVVAFQDTLDDFALTNTGMVEVERPDGSKVLMQRGISRAKLEASLKNGKRYAYSQAVAEIIVEQMLEGKTLKSICKQEGYPTYAQICRWRNENEDFAKAIETARQYRAEFFHDELVELQEGIGDSLEKEEVAAKKLRMEALKWLTERNDQGRYGGGKKHEAQQAAGAIKIVVNTGINRDTDMDVIEISNGDE